MHDDDAVAGPQGTQRPLTAATGLWLAAPDVLADPTQVEDGRVWTRARDVLPGRRVTHGEVLVAAWAEQTFRARAEWDAEVLDQLWLHPLTAATGPPRLDRERLRAALDDAASPGAHRNTLAGMIEDLADAFDQVVAGVGASRGTARAMVRLLDEVPGPFSDPEGDLCAHEAVLALQWHARLPLRRRC